MDGKSVAHSIQSFLEISMLLLVRVLTVRFKRETALMQKSLRPNDE
jgi:hypothetical protein